MLHKTPLPIPIPIPPSLSLLSPASTPGPLMSDLLVPEPRLEPGVRTGSSSRHRQRASHAATSRIFPFPFIGIRTVHENEATPVTLRLTYVPTRISVMTTTLAVTRSTMEGMNRKFWAIIALLPYTLSSPSHYWGRGLRCTAIRVRLSVARRYAPSESGRREINRGGKGFGSESGLDVAHAQATDGVMRQKRTKSQGSQPVASLALALVMPVLGLARTLGFRTCVPIRPHVFPVYSKGELTVMRRKWKNWQFHWLHNTMFADSRRQSRR
ncbi:hypothetical protein DFH94DRAFT_801491 [Russula ochroleuca]|uniref:Uncharacterized protein n=1 Tax=Russula ochroleuca TaxID=152965 RepID=A0A9P5MT20_9AGAM|nr:hypothetical protein DFH94DRAFT_801491 [Russula ochroleuca]